MYLFEMGRPTEMCDERGGIQFAWRAILEVDRYVLCTRPRLLLVPSLAAAAATYTSDTEYVKMTHRNVPAAAEEIQRAGCWCWNEGYGMAMSPVLLLRWDA